MSEPARTVLLIEDNESHVRLVERYLARARGLRLESASTLGAGLDRLRTGGVEVVLLDLGLPDSSRDETLGRVLSVAPDVPVVVLTTAEDLDAAVRSVQQGAQDDLPKSQLSAELLTRSIRYAIERKQAELRLSASERLYRAIGESIDFGVWVCDAGGRNLYASPSFLDLVGLTQEECSEFGWGRVLHPEDAERTLAEWKECARVGGEWNIEHRFRGRDGRWHPILARGTPVRDDAGRITHWAGINLDISDFKRAEEALRDLNATLEERVAERTAVAEERAEKLRLLATELGAAQQTERRRIAQVIHDNFQQVLAAARMRADVLRTSLHQPQQQQMVAQIDKLLQQALDEARSLTMDLSPPVLRDRGLAAALDWLARRMHEQHGLSVRVEAEADAELPEATASLLFEATRELLFNTVKHAGVPDAAVTFAIADGGTARLVVSDAGRGFETAAMADAAFMSEHFGLFSIRERFNLVGGAVTVKSAPGRGTQVTLTAPLPTPPPPAPQAPGSNGRHGGPGPRARDGAAPTEHGPIRVVLVDDHQLVREGLAGLIEGQGDMAVVGQAENGDAALRVVGEERPQVVVMDVSLPDRLGFEVTREILLRWPGVRVIGLSMHDADDYEAAMRAAGAVCYLSKTGPTELLLSEIRRCLTADGA